MSERFIDMDLDDLRLALSEASDEAEKEILAEAIIEMAAKSATIYDAQRRNVHCCNGGIQQINERSI